MAQPPKIRFGILCKGYQFPLWQVIAIEKLLAEKDIHLELLIFDERELNKKPTSKIKKIAQKLFSQHSFWTIYNNLHVKRKTKAGKLQNVKTKFSEIPTLTCKVTKKGKYSEYFSDEDVETIKAHNLDFILRFGFSIIRGKILEAAKFGVWSFHHNDEMKYRGTPPCFWEIFNGDPVTGSVLQRLTNKLDAGIILKRGHMKTDSSYVKNRDQLYFESTNWPRQLCVDIRYNQTEIFERPPSKTTAPLYRAPTNLQLLKFFAVTFSMIAKKAYKALFITDYWNVGVALAPISAFLDPDNLPEVKWFPNLPKNKFIADPFGIHYKGNLHIIYEDFLFGEGIGTIASLQFKNNVFTDNGIVIREDFHMSYPYIFEQNKNIYCIPETYQANQVRLYKAIDFPKKWKLEKVLIDNYAGIDNTLLFHDEKWWMFSTDKNSGAHYNLNIFYANDIFGNWQPHPKNPVKTDIRSARPAGSIFLHEGKIFRPAMDYSQKVEGRIKINSILKLTPTDFEEEVYCTVNPYTDTFFSDKIHTLSQTGPYTIVDGAKELFVFSSKEALQYKIYSRIKKLRG